MHQIGWETGLVVTFLFVVGVILLLDLLLGDINIIEETYAGAILKLDFRAFFKCQLSANFI